MAFDLGAMLRDVSKLDTGKESIEYISLGLIDKDPKNFYQLSDIKELADNIALCGLLDPLRVRPNPEKDGRYIIVSGHRRHAAIMEIKLEQPGLFEEVPCIVERAEVSEAMRQLRLIYANSDTRKMRPSELAEQAAQVEKLLYELKEQGYEFPGRMRDHVAEACKVSQSKLARLKVIREKLDPIWKQAWKSGKLPENKAYGLSQMPSEDQKLLGMYYASCPEDLRENLIHERGSTFKRLAGRSCDRRNGTPCINIERMREKAVKSTAYYYEECHGCCFDCDRLANCQYACPMAAEKKKQLRAEAKEEKKQEAEKQELRDRPKIQKIQQIYERIGKLRQEKNISAKQVLETTGRWFGSASEDKLTAQELGTIEITTHTELPFGFNFYFDHVRHLCDVADLLGCSIDYLLGRIDKKPTSPENVSDSDTWHYENPQKPGDYVVLFEYAYAGDTDTCICHWDGTSWDACDMIDTGDTILCWIAEPRREKS